MKAHYYPETDSLYIALRDAPGAETVVIAEGLNADLDAHGEVVGFDIEGASSRVELATLETIGLAPRKRAAGRKRAIRTR